MDLDLTAAFPTPIGRFRVPDAGAMNRDLQALILAEEVQQSQLSPLKKGVTAAKNLVVELWASAS